jgi:hypothetical protein
LLKRGSRISIKVPERMIKVEEQVFVFHQRENRS